MTLTATLVRPLDKELDFTDAYRRHQDAHVAIREAACLPYSRTFGEIQEGDLLAGRHLKVEHDPHGQLVGFGLEHEDSGRIVTSDVEDSGRGLAPRYMQVAQPEFIRLRG